MNNAQKSCIFTKKTTVGRGVWQTSDERLQGMVQLSLCVWQPFRLIVIHDVHEIAAQKLIVQRDPS